MADQQKYLVPVVIRFIEGKAVVTEYYELKSEFKEEKQILQPGDVILRINSEAVDSIIKRITPYISASNEASLLRRIAVDELLWSNDTLLYVDYERNGVVENQESNVYRIECVNLLSSKSLIHLLQFSLLIFCIYIWGVTLVEKFPKR